MLIIETMPMTVELMPQLLDACTKHGQELGRLDGVWRWSFGVRPVSAAGPAVVTVLELQDLSGHGVYN